jgi:hypothetical protein
VTTATELALRYRDEREARAVRTQEKEQRKQWALEAAAARASKLAGQISDPVLLLACLRFYVSLPRGEWVPSAPIHERTKDAKRIVKRHLTAARRVLQVKQRDYHREIHLPLNWMERLRTIGLNVARNSEFLKLNEELHLDSDMQIFAAHHPELLQRVRSFIRGELQPTDKPAKKADKHWWTEPKAKAQNLSLHEAMAAGRSDDEPDEYDSQDDEEIEPEEPDLSAFNRATWLKGRISAFLRDKEL